MGYLDRQRRIKLYEEKLRERKLKEEVLSSKKGSKTFKAGQKVSYKDNEYIVKYCADGNCVIERDSKQEFVPSEDLELLKDNKLDELKEGIYQVTYSTDGINYHSNVLVKAENEKEAIDKVMSSVKVKPHEESEVIVRERDQSFVDDYHGKRGMRMLESLPVGTLGRDAERAVRDMLKACVSLTESTKHLSINDLDKMINNLQNLRESINDSNDFLLEDFADEEEMPETPTVEEDNGVTSLLNLLLKDEIDAVDGYNSTITTLRGLEGSYEDIIKVLTDIAGEENIHIGQLQKVLEIVNPQAELISNGVKEAEETIEGESDEDN